MCRLLGVGTPLLQLLCWPCAAVAVTGEMQQSPQLDSAPETWLTPWRDGSLLVVEKAESGWAAGRSLSEGQMCPWLGHTFAGR